jgi:hypothetical protein
MKTFTLLFTLFYYFNALAAAPYGIKGQQQTSTLYSNVHQFPNNLVTNLGGIDALVETGNNNILSNPSFEHLTPTTSWTNSGTSPLLGSTSLPIHGKKHVVYFASAQTIDLSQSSTLYASQFASGVQGLAMIRINSDIALKVCSVQAGTASTTNCVTTTTNGTWGLYKVPFILGGTSNGISITSTGSVSGTVIIDDAFVGGINLESQNGACITADCTTAFSAFVATAGTVSNENIDSINGNCVLTNGTTTTCTFNAGLYTVAPNCAVSGNGGGEKFIASVSSATVAIGYANSAGSGGAKTDVTIICQKQGADFTQAEAKKTGNVFTTQCGANCVDTYSAVIASTTTDVVTSENVDFINGNCTTATTGRSTCTFNSGIVTQPLSCSCSTVINAAGRGCAILVQSSSSVLVSTTSSGVEADGIGFNLICQKQGADFVATRTIQGTFNEVNTSPGISKPKTCHYAFGGASATLASPTLCATGTCLEVVDSCNAFSPPSRSTAGGYLALTIASGTFANSSLVSCACNGFSTTNNARICTTVFNTGQNTWSANSSGGLVTDIFTGIVTGTGTDSYVTVTCKGQAP